MRMLCYNVRQYRVGFVKVNLNIKFGDFVPLLLKNDLHICLDVNDVQAIEKISDNEFVVQVSERTVQGQYRTKEDFEKESGIEKYFDYYILDCCAVEDTLCFTIIKKNKDCKNKVDIRG